MTDNDELLYELCFDDERSSAVYTTHIIDLANKGMSHSVGLQPIASNFSILHFIVELERSSHLSFKAPYTLYGLKVQDKYNAAKQTERFSEIFGKITSENLKEMNYFSRNHLTPHADFPLASEQNLTYYFQNCVPGE